MSADRTGTPKKTIQIGPGYGSPYASGSGDTCCYCCQVCSTGLPVGLNSCPAHCCPCPPTGNICLTFQDLGGTCQNLNGTVIELDRAAGIALQNANAPYGTVKSVGGTPCYDPTAKGCDDPSATVNVHQDFRKSLLEWPHEKWATPDGGGSYAPITLCAPGSAGITGTCAGGSGEEILISLACCDLYSSAAQAASFSDECHGCRYQLRFSWSARHNPPPGAHWEDGDFCTCPVIDAYSEYYIPPNECSPQGDNIFTWPMVSAECGSGNADNWKVVFEIHNELWHCDCCRGAVDDDTSPCTGNVSMRVIATPKPPAGC